MSGVKIVGIGISIFLVVGVVLGVIVGVGNRSSSDDSEKDLATSGKAVSTICDPTEYKEACMKSLGTVVRNGSATPKEFIQAAIDVTIEKVKDALSHSGNISQGVTNATQKMALDDCKDLLQFAIAELQASFSSVGEASMHSISDREDELRNWLSAVISYQESCLDGVTQPELKTKMSDGMRDAAQLTSNALAIVSAISRIMSVFKLPPALNITGGSRRLLDNPQVDKDGFPAWFSVADRRLLSQGNAQPKPNAVVAKDGSGQYKTIAAALAAYPKKNKGRYVIYVKAGVYDECITVTKDQTSVFMYGDGPRKTMVTGKKSYKGGYTTMQTATFSAVGTGFVAKSMGFQNTAGPEGHQAVALRVQSDMSAFYNCRMDGYQDTLYAQTHRQFYRNCVISGTVDFIFGDAAAVIQNCLIVVRKPMDNQQNMVTAQGRVDKHESTGFVIQNCRIVPEQKLYPLRLKIPSYLGRPWKQYSRTVIMESTIGDLIQPAGWMPWNGDFALDTLFYAEYANRGPGAETKARVKWKGYKVMTNKNEAIPYTTGPFIQGNLWLKFTGAPYFLGLKN
ncbi:hypothetical protein QQ045_009469 [Rhodiola kirilowii]